MTGKDVKQRQRAHHVVRLGKEQAMPQPAVVDHAGIFVLRDLGHAGGAAGVEIGRHPVARAVGKFQRRLLRRHRLVIVAQIGMVAGRVLGTHKRHDPALGRAEIAIEVDLQHRVDIWRVAHRLGGFLRDVGFRKRLERDHHLGPGLAQDGGDLFGLQQRVDRVHDPRDRGADGGCRGFQAIGQDQGDNIALVDLETAKQVGRLTALVMELLPCQGLRLFGGAGQQLIADRGPVGKGARGMAQHLIERCRFLARLPWHFVLNVERILPRRESHRYVLP